MILLFGVSGGEIFVVLLFVLIFFGSDKIPGIARTMGRAIRQVKDATADIQRDFQDSANSVKDQFKDSYQETQKLKDSVEQSAKSIEDNAKIDNS